MIKFTEFSSHHPGLLYDILMKSYESCSELVQAEEESWQEFDDFVFSNLDKLNKCGFVSCLEHEHIGFASWDPRNHPEIVIIGHNCILPEYRNKGFGRLQVLEMLKRFEKMGFTKATVTTGSIPFFLPAQRMYLSCGFREVGRTSHHTLPDFEIVNYEKECLTIDSG